MELIAYIGETSIEGHNTIEIQYIPHVGYLYPGFGFYVLSDNSRRASDYKFQVIALQRLLLFGKFDKYSRMIMQTDDKIWSQKCFVSALRLLKKCHYITLHFIVQKNACHETNRRV